jgi:hypothetical protein
MEKMDKKTSSAKRQQALASRRREAGFKRTTVWIHSDSEAAGYLAFEQGLSASEIPETADRFSWVLGYAKAASS